MSKLSKLNLSDRLAFALRDVRSFNGGQYIDGPTLLASLHELENVIETMHQRISALEEIVSHLEQRTKTTK